MTEHRPTLQTPGAPVSVAPAAHDLLLLLYDFLHTRGGAERVLHTLYSHFPAQVCVAYVNEAAFADAFAPQDLLDLGVPSFHPMLASLLALPAFAWRGERIARRYGRRLYSGAYAVLAHSADHGGQAIYYCHTPPRFLYDLKAHYAATANPVQRLLLRAVAAWLQPRYERAVRAMDAVIANSANVQRRLRQYVGVEAEVIHPPVDIERFRWRAAGDYFFSTARLEPLKRVESIVRAFVQMPEQRLVVSSGGSEAARLRTLAADAANIHFTGWLDDGELARWMGEARASIYLPVDEDFGMSPVESMAAGKPVIGVSEGGLLETVVEGETGLLLAPDFDVDTLCAAVRKLDAGTAAAMRSACEARAQMFSRERFLAQIGPYVTG